MFQELDLINNLIHGNVSGKSSQDSPHITSSSFFGSVNNNNNINSSVSLSNNTVNGTKKMSENSRTPSFGGPQNVVMNGTRMSSTPSSHSSADSIASRQSCSPTAEAISNLLLGGHQNTSNSQLIGNQQQQQHVSNATAMSSSNNHATVSQGGVLSAGAGNNNLLDFSVSQLYGGHFADQLDVSNLFQGMSSHINNSANSHLQQQNPASTNPNNNLGGPTPNNTSVQQQLNSHLNTAASQAVSSFSQQASAEALHNGLLSQMQSPGGVTAALAAFGQQSQQQQQQTETQRLQHNSVNGGQSQQQQPAGAIRQRHRSSASDSMFKCNYCPKKYPSQAALQNHMDDCRNIRVHECSQCGKRFKARGGLQQHNRIHINDRPYHCHYCPKRFTQKSHVDQHERIHTGLKPFSCQFCGRAFRQRSQQMGHEATHTNGHSNSNGSVSAVSLALANQSLGQQHAMDRDSHRNSLSSDQTSCQNSPSNDMNSPRSSSLNNQLNQTSSQPHQIQQQQQQQQFAQQQSSQAAAAAAAASLQHAQQQMNNINMMAQMGQMAQGLGQDMKLQQNMLQNMLNGGASQLAADSLLALKHDPSYQLLFANGNHRQQQQLQPAANKTTINDYM